MPHGFSHEKLIGGLRQTHFSDISEGRARWQGQGVSGRLENKAGGTVQEHRDQRKGAKVGGSQSREQVKEGFYL